MPSDFAALGPLRWSFWMTSRMVYAVAGRLLFRHRVRGLDRVPSGGFLLLGNHTSAPDNLWLAWPLGRPTHIMTSAGMFRNPVAGALLRLVNCFPKAVGTRDEGALKAVRDRLAQGQIVQIMPEGLRTWDGRLMPIRPGIGKLVADLGATVVVCRTLTGHLWWPRWGRWPRWVPVETEYEVVGPWPEGTETDQIWRDIVEALETPANPTPTGSWGLKVAEGLESFLFACPGCFALGRTTSSGSTFSCGACEASWQVDVHQQMQGEPTLTVRDAWDRIAAELGPMPRMSPEVVLSDRATLIDRKEGAVRGQGPTELTEEALCCGDFSLPLSDLRAVTMDAGNTLLLRTQEGVLQLQPEGSTWMWFTFLQPRLAR